MISANNVTNSNENIVKIVNDQNQGYLYRDLGTYHYNHPDGSTIRVKAYIWKRPNSSGYYSEHRYEYVLTAISESVFQGKYTQTWLYNNRIYYNGQEITQQQYPNGFTTYINTIPTIVYSIYTSDENIPAFTMQWGNSAYENR